MKKKIELKYLDCSGNKFIPGRYVGNSFIAANDFMLVFPDGTCEKRKFRYLETHTDDSGQTQICLSFRFQNAYHRYYVRDWNYSKFSVRYRCLHIHRRLPHVLFLGDK
ncbi:hypothetical protein UFOVP434_84 [uncultured Caudovirales phage]|uniref:Uncharacterized protein n=1 Tax=uncultured Caudovirales phage TaxID=2100421 RepID=A0A6J5MHG1_9CAUD|nr:hypothetical protein UFOVP434_84 [uncultured Caudovirales phage]